MTDKARQRALLLHYVGEATNEIFETLPDTEATEDQDPNLGFKHRKITPVWPRANGEVERLVRTVKKIMKTSCVGKKNFKQELNRFLRNYQATPHSTTRIPPATALFGRSMKTKLPEIAIFLPDNEMRDRDKAAKAKMKAYADNKSYVKPSTLKEGDIVLVRRDRSKRKSDTPYREDPYKVIQKKGTMITAQTEEGKELPEMRHGLSLCLKIMASRQNWQK